MLIYYVSETRTQITETAAKSEMKRSNETRNTHTHGQHSRTENWGRRRHSYRLFNFVRHFRSEFRQQPQPHYTDYSVDVYILMRYLHVLAIHLFHIVLRRAIVIMCYSVLWHCTSARERNEACVCVRVRCAANEICAIRNSDVYTRVGVTCLMRNCTNLRCHSNAIKLELLKNQ